MEKANMSTPFRDIETKLVHCGERVVGTTEGSAVSYLACDTNQEAFGRLTAAVRQGETVLPAANPQKLSTA
jgi:hypothetical protein